MTQKERLLAALQRGPVCQADFLLPDVVDGGKPIARIAARVLDLRNDGEPVENTGEIRQGYDVYALRVERTATGETPVSPPVPVPSAEPEPTPLFGDSLSPYDAYGDAA